VFLDHPQRVLNRDQLLNLTQGRDAELFERSIDLLVSRCASGCGRMPASRPTLKRCAAKGMSPVSIREGMNEALARCGRG
jgi:hypothetical protein